MVERSTSAAAPRGGWLTLRVGWLCVLALLLALVGGSAAHVLMLLIAGITNLAFYGRWSLESVGPAGNALGAWVILVPVAGALVIGVMARYGSAAIRGHGIPEAMDQVLHNNSRIPARMAWLKPLSAAISIGTGGPFGAEGPIIATGGALGSLLGQLLPATADERKTLLAAGAAAGMAATFGSPVSAVLLAVELLLFEYRPRSILPVAIAAVGATGVRYLSHGATPAFEVGSIGPASSVAVLAYLVVGALVGLGAVVVTKLVYGVEDQFERLPLHWMWWPALGAVAVGVIGWYEPHTMGVGYDNIEGIVSGRIAGGALAVLCVLKWLSWTIALGSGTSGGTLAPLFTLGGALGAGIGVAFAAIPGSGVDPRMAALVGMAAMFAGASRALLASVVFAFETTQQPYGMLPLLGGCAGAYLVSCACMRHSIMTEKIARRGGRVPMDYVADHLERVLVADACSRDVVVLDAGRSLADVRLWMTGPDARAAHQGFPVLARDGSLIGVVTRRQLTDPRRGGEEHVGALVERVPICVREDATLREAADRMTDARIGRLPVLDAKTGTRLVGIVTRSDVLGAHEDRLHAAHATGVELRLPFTRG